MQATDLPKVNGIIAAAFSHQKKMDGYTETFFPPSHFQFLKMYLDACPDGCFVVEKKGRIVAAAFSHAYGQVGWIGPIVVMPRHQSAGIGKWITGQCINYLKKIGCKTIGLETLPSNLITVGFYGKLDFEINDVIIEMASTFLKIQDGFLDIRSVSFAKSDHIGRQKFLDIIKMLSANISKSFDYSPLVQQFLDARYGDTFIFFNNQKPIGFAILQFEPIYVIEKRNILRVITLLSENGSHDKLSSILNEIVKVAIANSFDTIRFRVPCRSNKFFHFLLNQSYAVAFTNLRWTLKGFPESTNSNFIHLNSWV